MASSPPLPGAEERPQPSAFPRAVWLLGWVSLATDAASEAIYPLLPFFLTQVLGAGAISLGLVEGAAEAANSLLKIWSGREADRRAKKRWLVLFGYTISSLVRPLVAIAQSWVHVLTIRLLDRVGKGIRGAPRDAMLATWTTDSNRGRVYGFHRGMDHTGAVIGPIIATAFLYFYPGEYRTLFSLAIIPGAIAVLLLFFVKEDGAQAASDSSHALRTGHRTPGRMQSDEEIEDTPESTTATEATDGTPTPPLPRELNSFFGVLALFTLGSSTDAFLILKLTDAAGSARYIPLIWAALHVVKASTSMLGGSWSDKWGRRTIIAAGWLVYAAVYFGFAFADSLGWLLAWFLIYGLYFGLTEGTEKALVADLAPAASRGFAFGVYNAVLGVGGLVASVMFGVLWNAFGDAVAFGSGAALAFVSTALLLLVVRR